jgi:hypothetical protein
MGTRSFLGVKWLGHGTDNPPHLVPRLKKEHGYTSTKYQKLPYYGTLKEAGREEDLRLAGEDRSPKKWAEA